MKGILFPFKRWWLWQGELCCVALVAVKRPGCVLWQLECHARTSQQVFKVTTNGMDTRFHSPLINRIVHHAVLKFSPCLNKPLPQLVRIADWYFVYTHLHHATDAVINQV